MKTIIVLAMHGAPPKDFPRQTLREFFGLSMKLEHGDEELEAEPQGRYEELERQVRQWPRTPHNDPFHAGSLELARNLQAALDSEVIVGFNEFCSPSLDDAFNQAVEQGAGKIIVVTPMMTRGGEHSEKDIPEAMDRARQRHPEVEFRYAWPVPLAETVRFLAAQVSRLMD
jgi:sirohydrochlorin cobaltochelatase